MGHFSHAKVNVPFGANGKVKWGILANIPWGDGQEVGGAAAAREG